MPARTEPPDTSDGADAVIQAERAHLVRSREYLRIMRENVLAINPMAGDPVSLEFLKADLYRRAESLKDVPDAPLFFGRLDYPVAGDLDLAVAIRTALVRGGRLSLSVGGGVVIDSTPDAELAETEVKARAFARLCGA